MPMPATAQVKKIADDQWQLLGTLNLETVNELLRQGQQHLADTTAAIINIDLAQVSYTDSTGLALLLAWLRRARQCNKTIRFQQLPTQLQAMAQLCGLAGYLETKS